VIGEQSGSPTVTLVTAELPKHSHSSSGATVADATSPAGAFYGSDTRGTPLTIYNSSSDGTMMNPTMIKPAGGSQPHQNMQPYLCVNVCICLYGLFPSRN
jgi:microcystin-dependent protein